MMNAFNNLLFYFDKRLGVAQLLTLGLEIQEKHKGILCVWKLYGLLTKSGDILFVLWQIELA